MAFFENNSTFTEGDDKGRKIRDKVNDLKSQRSTLVANKNYAKTQAEKDKLDRKIIKIDDKINKLQNK